MRSSKSRSRNKNNNRRPAGNVVNRVFDSSGPEGKVRGTPQQIIDKYNGLARDAQLSGDRVAVENFQQHAEHYTRMLGEAMREQNERREAQEAQQAAQNQNNGGEHSGRDNRSENAGGGQRNRNRRDRSEEKPTPVDAQAPAPEATVVEPQEAQVSEAAEGAKPSSQSASTEPKADVQPSLELPQDTGSDLVETPETKPARKPRAQRPRKPRAPKKAASPSDETQADAAPALTPDAE